MMDEKIKNPFLAGMVIGIIGLVWVAYAPVVSASTNKASVYNTPKNFSEILRREAGDIGTSDRSMTRSFMRSITRSITRGFTRSITRSLNRGFTRSMTRSEARSIIRSITRGENRSLARSLARGESRSITRSLSRSLTRGDSRSLTESLMRGKDAQTDQVVDEIAAQDKETTAQTSSGDEELRLPSLMAPLASKDIGYTSKSQPAFRWYISDAWPGRIEFTLNEFGKIEPVIETMINGPDREGIYEINLSDYGVKLKPDVLYEWFIAIIPLPKERSADFLGSAAVKYMPMDEALAKRLKKAATDDQLYSIYAETGYWYDAIDRISSRIDEKPNDRNLRSRRVALLEQVKLGKVVDFDRAAQ